MQRPARAARGHAKTIAASFVGGFRRRIHSRHSRHCVACITSAHHKVSKDEYGFLIQSRRTSRLPKDLSQKERQWGGKNLRGGWT
jgi:hypothetical protein